MIKRFFTKKSIAFLFTSILLVGFFSFIISPVQVHATTDVITIHFGGKDFTYSGNNLWKPTTGEVSITTESINSNYTGFSSLGNIWTSNPITTDIQKRMSAYDADPSTSKANPSTTNMGIAGYVGKAVGKVTGFAANTIGYTVGTVFSFSIEFIAVPIASFYLAIAGMVLDFSVQYTIFGQGFSAMTDPVQNVWVLVRDTLNICFIFILLYSAIIQIIKGEASKKILSAVIISAVLINFSLFLSKIVIDASNLVATSIYKQILVVTTGSSNIVQNIMSDVGAGALGKTSDVDLSESIMDSLGLTTIFEINGMGGNNKLEEMASSIVGVGGFINSALKLSMFFITIFVFLMLAALLIGRFVMLVMLLATSPIGFVGDVVPGIGEYSKKWKETLLNQCLIAPLFMFFMLLTIRISQILATTTAKTGNPMILFFNFFIVVFLLLKSVSITKSLSGPIGEFAAKIASVGTGLALGAATGGTAFVARQSIGRGASMLDKSGIGEGIKAHIIEGGIGSGILNKVYGGTVEKAAKGTFDMRNTDTMGTMLGHAKDIAGTALIDSKYATGGGTYGKGTGYAGMLTEKTENAIKTAKDADKAAKDYEQRIVDRNPEMIENYKYKKQKEIDDSEKTIKEKEDEMKSLDKERKIKMAEFDAKILAAETLKKTVPQDEDKINEQIKITQNEKDKLKNSTEEKKASIQNVIAEAKETKNKALADKNDLKSSDIIASHNSDFGSSETKVANFMKQEKDLNDNKTKLENDVAVLEEILEKNGLSDVQLEELNKTKEMISVVDSELGTLKKEYENAKGAIKVGKISDSKILKKLKGVRGKMADNYRSFWKTNTLWRNENREIASKIIRDTPKQKTDKERDLETMAKMEAAERMRLEKEAGNTSPKKEEPKESK